MSFLPSVRIVLMQTYHPGNIGAVARAMKTMGLSELFLVSPLEYPHEEATSRAAGALDVLESAQVVSSLEEAISGCTQVFATTARRRGYTRPQQTADEAAGWIADRPSDKVAIVFGRERMGLSNEDIDRCQQILYIPGNPEYDVLNLAAAAQIVCYELHQASLKLAGGETLPDSDNTQAEFAPAEDMERFYDHLENTLSDTGFLIKNHPGEAMQRLKQMFARTQPTDKELRMLRGILASVDRLTDS